MKERLGIAGSGAIACGLACAASEHGEVVLWARSDESARRARASVARAIAKRNGDGAPPERVTITTELGELASATFVVEAIVEDHGSKARLLHDLGRSAASDAVLATTTSSLSVGELARASGRPQRFAALHVFNPVPKMALVELAFPAEADERTRERARALCAALGKTAVEVPDMPGFVVNRLLFPFLFSAVELMEETGLDAADIDRCMKLGAGHPMGPLALLDYVGLDVSLAIGETIGATIPERIRMLVADGALGRKTGRGLHEYE